MNLVLTGVLLGIAFSTPPGAVMAEALRRGMKDGLRGALGIELGSVIGDATYGVLALAGAAALVQRNETRLLMGAAGALVLLYLGWSGLRQAMSADAGLPSGGLPGRMAAWGPFWGAFATGCGISLLNPFQVAFWLGIGGAVLAVGMPNPTRTDTVIFFLSYIAGCTAWAVFLSILIGVGRRLLRPVVFRALSLLCGLALGGYGVYLGYRTWIEVGTALLGGVR